MSDRLVHHYGQNVHIVDDVWSRSLLARLSHPDTSTRDVHPLLDACYRRLLAAAVDTLPTADVDWPTRMTAGEPRARNRVRVADPSQQVVVVDVARGGILPAALVHRGLMEILPSTQVRQDHLYLQRVPDPQTGAVARVDHAGSKIGGPAAGATVLVPDPMAATGSSLEYVLGVYRNLPGGAPRRVVTMHLIVTPEYLRRIARDQPDLDVYALRVDRGLSPADVLATVPGARWDEERGLDDHDYIVPGAGGVGEVINNSFV